MPAWAGRHWVNQVSWSVCEVDILLCVCVCVYHSRNYVGLVSQVMVTARKWSYLSYGCYMYMFVFTFHWPALAGTAVGLKWWKVFFLTTSLCKKLILPTFRLDALVLLRNFLPSEAVKNLSSFHVYRSNWEISTFTAVGSKRWVVWDNKSHKTSLLVSFTYTPAYW